VRVAARALQRDDRIPDELTQTVEGHVPAASRLVELDPAGGERGLVEQEVSRTGAPAQSDDGRVLEQEQGVGRGTAPPEPHEPLLERRGLRVGDAPEKAAGQRHSSDSSNSWRTFFTKAKNWSATAPSTTRWS